MSTYVNLDAWGAAFTEYSGLNVRTGASDLTDTDFEDFPPFVRNSFDTETEIQYLPKGDLYYPYLADNDIINLNKPIDRSIAYCACKNMDIPINQIWGYSCTPDSAASQYPELTDTSAIMLQSDSTPIPIMLLDTIGIGQARSHGMGASQHYFRNPFYRSSQGVFYQQHLWTQYAKNEDISGNAGNPNDNGGRGRSNKNLFAAYYRDFGLRSFFLQIRVKYYNSISTSTEIPSGINDHSLYWYSQQTESWKEDHPLTGAYGRLIVRSSTAGAYTNGNNINSDITINLRSNWNFGEVSIGDLIQQPIANVDTEYLQSAFPIFGTTAPNNWQTTETGTHSNGGISQNVAILIGGGENSPIVHRQGKDGTQYKGTMWCELAGTDDNLELIRKWCAAYGLFFTDGENGDSGYSDLYAAGNDETRWTNEKMCLGVVDNEGYTDGTYTRGMDNETANNWDWKTASQSPYDPSRPPPTPTMSYDDITTFNDISNIATLTRRYALTKQNVEDLGSELWQISSDIINNIQNDEWYKYTADVMDTFLVTDPLSCIVSLQKYPLTIPEQSGPVNIKLGKAETSISANITKATAKTYYFAPVQIQPRFGNSFMDYEPYTHFELYVPFCGTTELDPRDILGRTLSVNLVVDFNTGTCVAYVLSGSLVIETINGSLAIDIPVTGVDSTTIASNITQGIINTRNARYTHQFGTLGKVASPSGIVSNVSNVWGSAQTILTSENNAKLSEYELTHQPAQPHVIGSASPVGSWAIDFKCRLLIYYPTGGIVDESKVADSSQPIAFDNTVFEQYQTQIGFATVDPVTALGESYAHTLVCAEKAILNNVTTPNGRPATEPELQLIRQALQEGVILP